MERIFTIGICDWASNDKAGTEVEEVIADNKGRTSAFLLMSRLRVKT